MVANDEVEYKDITISLALSFQDPLSILIRAEEGDEEALALLRGW